MKKILFIVVMIWGITASAQREQGWEIVYNIGDYNETPQTKNESAGTLIFLAKTLLQAKGTNLLEIKVTDDNIRIEDVMIQSIEIVHKKTDNAYLLSEQDREVVEIKSDATNRNKSNQNRDAGSEEIAVSKPKLLSDMGIIAGVRVKKAIVSIKNSEEDATIIVWYAPTIPKVYFQDYMYLKDIPGAALAVLDENTNVGFVADKVEKRNFSSSIFEVPTNYKKVSALRSGYKIDFSNFGSSDNYIFDNGNYWFESGKYFGIKDKSGTIITKPTYLTRGPFSEQVAIVSKRDFFGVVDQNGNEIIPCIYDYIEDATNGFLVVMKDNLYGFANTKGKLIVAPKYHYAMNFSEQLAVVSEGSKYGFINANGEIVIPLIYDYASSFQNGKAEVTKNDIIYSINKKGEQVK